MVVSSNALPQTTTMFSYARELLAYTKDQLAEALKSGTIGLRDELIAHPFVEEICFYERSYVKRRLVQRIVAEEYSSPDYIGESFMTSPKPAKNLSSSGN